MSLDAFLDELPDDEIPTEIVYWVTDLPSATRAMGKVANIDAQIAEIVDTANDRIDRINQFRNDECARLKQQRGYYEALLAHFHSAVLASDPKRKTIRLDNGHLSARKQSDNIEIPDEQRFVAWAAGTEYTRAKYEINRQVVKDAVLKNGEILPGVSIVPGETTYNASPN